MTVYMDHVNKLTRKKMFDSIAVWVFAILPRSTEPWEADFYGLHHLDSLLLPLLVGFNHQEALAGDQSGSRRSGYFLILLSCLA